jgi:hypothetical protein
MRTVKSVVQWFQQVFGGRRPHTSQAPALRKTPMPRLVSLR